MSDQRLKHPQWNTFVVRIWWEPGLTWPDGRPLWRGQVQHTSSERAQAFQSLDELLRFIQLQIGDQGTPEGSARNAPRPHPSLENSKTSDAAAGEKTYRQGLEGGLASTSNAEREVHR